MKKIAILDDFQRVALQSADWSPLATRAELTVFSDHLDDQDALAARLAPFDAVCLMRERTPLRAELLERLPRLKFIGSNGARNLSIDVPAAQRLGIQVSATSGKGNGAPELTWALLLAAARQLPAEQASLRAGGWQTGLGVDLEGSTLGLLGLGQIGARVARVALAFGMNVIAWSPHLTEEAAAAHGVTRVDKTTLLRTSDWLSLHLVLSERSRHIIGPAELELMKPAAWLINTSRGPLVDEAALIEALNRRSIAGAALDVFDQEPLPTGHPFRRMDNVLATPHIGFVTRETYRGFYGETVENLLAWLDGAPIRLMSG
ncbi:D-2-hydroxyacid dehydrogenase family protein [Frateuria aurantia]